jgi:hypothetical protein
VTSIAFNTGCKGGSAGISSAFTAGVILDTSWITSRGLE